VSSKDEQQKVEADWDRQITELGFAISRKPMDATPYRKRGLLFAHQGEYEPALRDLSRALSLDPNDSLAYYIRAQIFHLKQDNAKAIADIDNALALDPTNAKYRSKKEQFRKTVTASIAEQTGTPTLPLKNEETQKRLAGFFKRLAQYYAEFLSTDFKKQRLPRRRLENSDVQGRLIGISLRKYPGFQQKMWEELTKPIGAGISLTISRGVWHSVLPKAVIEAIATQIATVSEEDLNTIITSVVAKISSIAQKKRSDPDIAFEQFIEELRAALARRVVGPLLDRMEGFFERTEYKPIESLRELEDQLSARLSHGVENASGAAFSTLLVDGTSDEIETVLKDQLNAEVVRHQLEDYFESFSASDLFVELSDLIRSSRLIENSEFYLHIGEIHHGGHIFPAFYVPFTVERTETTFKITSDTRVYVNKRAMDYVAQEVARSEGRKSIPSVLHERIFYLSSDKAPVGLVQKLFDGMAAGFNLRAEINFEKPSDQKVSSVFVVATNRLSFSLFDRSDESMVNDYEALITGIDAGDDVVEFFELLINDFLLHDPVPVGPDVDREWEDMPMPERLVFDSPLPLVEEQRKILSAIKHPKSRFIAVEGPPGTGKSHAITAVAFELILSGRSLLILSDKKEALDVVENKLNQALAKVRPSEDFPNPILRLGKDASNYAKLMRKNAIERLQVNQRIMRRERPARQKALEDERSVLITGLEKTVTAYANIDLSEIAKLEQDVGSLIKKVPVAEELLKSEILRDLGIVIEFARSNPVLAALLRVQGDRPSRLLEIANISKATEASHVLAADIAPITSFSLDQLALLTTAIEEIANAKLVIFGYLFAGRQLRAVSKRLKEHCNLNVEKPAQDLDRLIEIQRNLVKICEHLKTARVEPEFSTAIYLIASKILHPDLVPPHVLDSVRRIEDAMSQSLPLLDALQGQFYAKALDNTDGRVAALSHMADLKVREARFTSLFQHVPKIDYIGAKAKIESLNTQMLAERIDDRFIDFYNNKKNIATSVGKIIRDKERFPTDKFGDIQDAFPCVIAGLRDYAEYIPLKRDLFDLVIIDEASQVSIAQALPAIIRAKKALVLGDRNQFGNVKTTTASKEVNIAYMQDLEKSFDEDFPNASGTVATKIDLFNIKSSVLDFVEPISNFSVQLKKHFRSYPEMIGFSSKYFYGDSLQVMKIRGKPIEEVIEFDELKHDGLVDLRNVNVPEAERIVQRLTDLLQNEHPPTVGVITPHTEQQAFVAKLVNEHARSEEFYDKLRLKIMTFDTCQGEEREIILYSLVATSEKDRLAYIFPRTLDRDQSDEVDHNLRRQRLNVGLSRGQEKMVFVHSKPLEQYPSALRIALLHYRNELERGKAMPTELEIDGESPMERKVLHWLSQVPFIRDFDCEVSAQFEMGKYLKQLDPSYRAPDYRVDFLIRIPVDDRSCQIVLEYDGFEFHFLKNVASGTINSSTWRTYLTSDDVEREKTLESFGVPILRLNRFNLGDDPVATIDNMLRERLESTFNGSGSHDLVTRLARKVHEIEEGLKVGDYKRCSKCDRDLPIEMFNDRETKSGLGRYCRDCKSASAPRFRRYRR
jgi:tetratricopeptide (TPR) repeat protein